MRASSMALAVFALCAAVPAAAQSRDLAMVWAIQASADPVREVDVADDEFILKQTLIPLGLVALEETVVAGKSTLPAGSQLVQAQSGTGLVFCLARVSRALVGGQQPCLVDETADGVFDGFFNALSNTKGLLTISRTLPKRLKPITGGRYTKVPVETMRDRFFVGIVRESGQAPRNGDGFMIAFGSEESSDRLTEVIGYKDADLPRTFQVMGARLTPLSQLPDGRRRIRIDAAMPAQPFALATSVRYTLY